MSSSSARGYDDLTVEEVELALETARRRFAGMFNRATHPRWRTQKGTRKCTSGMIYIRSGDLKSLIAYATREIRAGDGLPANSAVKRAIVRLVAKEMLYSGTIKYGQGAWKMDEAVMEKYCFESERLANQAKELRRKGKEGNRNLAPARRARRGQQATA